MNLLLDTHVLLWALAKPKQLSDKAVNAIYQANNVFLVRLISGKLALSVLFGRSTVLIGLRIFMQAHSKRIYKNW